MKNQYSVFGFALILGLIACARSEERTESSSRSETCVNGVCSTSNSESTKVTKSGSTGIGVTIGSPVNPPAGVSVSVNVVGAGGGVSITPCSSKNAPLGACDIANVSVLMPKHLGCTASGAHAWSCQDAFSAAPPFSVVACSGTFSDSCTFIGSMY